MDKTWHYFEAHVTWDPVSDDDLDMAAAICRCQQFKIADLILLKSGAKHTGDMFTTGRGPDLQEVTQRMVRLIGGMKAAGFRLRRYKIEYTLVDSKHSDSLGFL